MKLEEIKAKYKDEWIAVEITKEDENRNAVEGNVIAHSKDREDTYNAMIKNKDKYLYHFYNGVFENVICVF